MTSVCNQAASLIQIKLYVEDIRHGPRTMISKTFFIQRNQFIIISLSNCLMFHVSLIEYVWCRGGVVSAPHLRLAWRVSFSRLLAGRVARCRVCAGWLWFRCCSLPALWWGGWTLVMMPDIFITPICFSYFPTFQLKYVYCLQICVCVYRIHNLILYFRKWCFGIAS